MRKVLVIVSLIIFNPLSVSAFPSYYSQPGLLNPDHMKQFNISELKRKYNDYKSQKNNPIQKTVLIKTIDFEMNKSYDEECLQVLVADKIGSKLTDINLNYIKNTIRDFYEGNGFVFVKVNAIKDPENEGAVLVKIEEGIKESVKLKSLEELN